MKTLTLNPYARMLSRHYELQEEKTIELDTKAKEKLEIALMESPQVMLEDWEKECLGRCEELEPYIKLEEEKLAELK